MSFQQRRAQRKAAFLKIGFSGPSGSGKTYSSLLLARGMASSWEKVTLIDTENGSGELYSHLGPYQVIPFEAPFSPERYIEAMQYAMKSSPEVIIIDGISHEWGGQGGVLEILDQAQKTSRNPNKMAAWADATPRHNKFVTALLQLPCHTIATIRSKTDWIMEAGKKPEKVGTTLAQREGFEYELTMCLDVTMKHSVTGLKDRTGLFPEGEYKKITEAVGEEIKKWNETGAPTGGFPQPDKLIAILNEISEWQGKKCKEYDIDFRVKIIYSHKMVLYKNAVCDSKISDNWDDPINIATELLNCVIDWEPALIKPKYDIGDNNE